MTCGVAEQGNRVEVKRCRCKCNDISIAKKLENWQRLLIVRPLNPFQKTLSINGRSGEWKRALCSYWSMASTPI